MEGVINSRKTHKEKAGKLKTLLTFKGKCAQMKMRFAIEAYTLLMLQVRIYSTKLNYLNMCVELDMNCSSIRPVEPAALHCDHVTRKIRSCKPNGRQIERERERAGGWPETGGKTKQRFAGHFGCGRAARHALSTCDGCAQANNS